MPADRASQRAAEQAIFAGAEDAGLRIAGIATSGRHESVVGRSDDGPAEIGARTTVTVRIAEDGSLLPRRDDSDESTPPATSILEIDVIPSVELDADGDDQVVWTAYAKQYDVETSHAIATSASSPEEVNPSGAADQMARSPAEAVARALAPLASSGRMNIGRLEAPPQDDPTPAPHESVPPDPPTVSAPPAPEPTSLGTWVKRGVALAAVGGVIAGGAFVFTGDDPPPTTQGQIEDDPSEQATDDPAEDDPVSSDPVEDDPVEDESSETPAEFPFDCADGLQPDDDGDRGGTASSAADDDPAIRQTNIICSGSAKGSFVFTMVVEGDGEAMTRLENLRWYNPRFVVNNDPATNEFFDDTGFAVDVRFTPRGVGTSVFDGTLTPIPESDYEATVEWTDPSTLVVTVSGFREELAIVNSRIELVARIENADGTSADFEDDAHFDATA